MFDPLKIKLYRSNLIESSAGTGKTHIISLLYLRFLLNINIEKEFSNLDIDKILIVTFTDLAVLEIKHRIKNFIKDLRVSLIKKYVVNDKIKLIYNYVKNNKEIIYLLDKYEKQIDIMSIFTIHGFCKKIIFSNFFDSGIKFNTKILSSEYNLIHELVLHFWNKRICFLSSDILKIIYTYWNTPRKLFFLVKSCLNFIKFDFVCKLEYYSIDNCYSKIIKCINNIKNIWLLHSNKIINFLQKITVKNKNVFCFNYKKLFLEIDNWCKSKTTNFSHPKHLSKIGYDFLLKKNNIFHEQNKVFFSKIDIFLKKKNDLYNYIIISCVKFVQKYLKIEKDKKSYLSFNDLIFTLEKQICLNRKGNINSIILNNFPVVLMDEFQDTDYIQYNIFYHLYIKHKFLPTKIILIGDPKQSIYTFRGANIFNYFKIKKYIEYIYTFNINWRSSLCMVKSINLLFKKVVNPFVFNDIKYIPLIQAQENKFLSFKKKEIEQSSVNFLFFDKYLPKNKYKNFLAHYCAHNILDLLNVKNKFFIFNKNKQKRNVISSDIAVLTYSNKDIEIIYDVFCKYQLPVSCVSFVKKNVFSTLAAREIYFILKSVLFPESKVNMGNTLSTYVFDIPLLKINYYLNNESKFVILINEFYSYYEIWNKFDIFTMLRHIVNVKKLITKNFAFLKNKQYVVNFIHISELLQKKNFSLQNKFSLLTWLNNKIVSSDRQMKDEYIIRSLENNVDKIKVSTIHKSKGLQYNIVFLPFLLKIPINKQYYYYHNRNNFKLKIDLYKQTKNKILFFEELLSEEIRLFYVAITRSVYQCNIFLYSFKDYLNNYNYYYINYLIKIKNVISYKELKKFFSNKIYTNYITIYNISCNDYNFYHNNKKQYLSSISNKINFDKCKILPYVNTCLRKGMFNYSNISSYLNNTNKIQSKLKYHNVLEDNMQFDKKLNIHNFPRGKEIGIFFHTLLENMDFQLNILNEEYLIKNLYQFHISICWLPIVKKIIFNILKVNLFNLDVNLCHKNIILLFKEFEFILPINKSISYVKFLNILKKHQFLSFNLLNNNNSFLYGYLNGVIDLVFIYKNKYYLVDYKSNFLGNTYSHYSRNNLHKVIHSYGYNIQYLFYSLALNNYLKLKINNYDYNYHFGGIFYIFFRGLKLNKYFYSKNGVFFKKIEKSLINKLSSIFQKDRYI